MAPAPAPPTTTATLRPALVGDLGDLDGGGAADGVTYVRVDHPVFRQREAQVQTMTGRRLPWAATRFTESLVSLLSARAAGDV